MKTVTTILFIQLYVVEKSAFVRLRSCVIHRIEILREQYLYYTRIDCGVYNVRFFTGKFLLLLLL